MIRRSSPGFTLLELLVALAFVATAALSLMAVVRSGLRQVQISRDLLIAGQAATLPSTLDPKLLGVRRKDVKTEWFELGPVQIESVTVEVTPQDRAEGIRLKVYK